MIIKSRPVLFLINPVILKTKFRQGVNVFILINLKDVAFKGYEQRSFKGMDQLYGYGKILKKKWGDQRMMRRR